MTGRRRVAAGLAILFASVFAQACGGSDSLSDPLPCATPTALPTVPAGPSIFGQRYLSTTNSQLAKLETIGAQFIDRWPSKKFSRTNEFRDDLAKTSDAAACLADQIRAAPSPSERFDQYDRALDDVLIAFSEQMAVGREAARQRNVSKFRDWLNAIEELPGQIDVVQAAAPSRP